LTPVVVLDRPTGKPVTAAPLQTLVAHPDVDEAWRFGMRDRGPSAGSPSVDSLSWLPLPDTDVVAAAWADRPPDEAIPLRPDQAKAVSGAMLALGVAMLLLVPLGGALFLAAGGLGLAISSQPSSSTDR
jgi:hypothetical protein